MNELALFAGAGGGVLGSRLLGHRIVCYVERDPYCVKVLKQRIADGFIDDAPIWDDVRTFDGKPWRGVVDCVSGGFPCIDISTAGKGAGIDGEHSGMWHQMARIIREVGPKRVFVENSPALTFRGLGRVLSDLATLGFDAEWGVFSACSQGAPHARERMFLAANSDRRVVRASRPHEGKAASADLHQFRACEAGQLANWWSVQPEPCSVVYGHAGVVDELRPFGNMQIPCVVRRAWELLSG